MALSYEQPSCHAEHDSDFSLKDYAPMHGPNLGQLLLFLLKKKINEIHNLQND